MEQTEEKKHEARSFEVNVFKQHEEDEMVEIERWRFREMGKSQRGKH